MDNLNGQVINVNGQQAATQPVVQPTPQVGNMQVAQATMQTLNGNVQAMFSQDQVNSIVSGRVNPLNTRIQDLTAQLAQAQQLSNSYLNELNGFKQRDMALKAGIPSQFVDFAVFEANKLAVSGKSFEAAIQEFATANVALFGTPQMSSQQQDANVTPNNAQAVQQNPANSTQTAQPQQQNVQGQVASNVQTTQSVPYVQQVQGVQALPNPQSVGASTYTGVGNSVITNNSVESEVAAFLAKKGVKKI